MSLPKSNPLPLPKWHLNQAQAGTQAVVLQSSLVNLNPQYLFLLLFSKNLIFIKSLFLPLPEHLVNTPTPQGSPLHLPNNHPPHHLTPDHDMATLETKRRHGLRTQCRPRLTPAKQTLQVQGRHGGNSSTIILTPTHKHPSHPPIEYHQRAQLRPQEEGLPSRHPDSSQYAAPPRRLFFPLGFCGFPYLVEGPRRSAQSAVVV
jgi:hypothetical protein